VKFISPIALCLGVAVGFLGCSVVGRLWSKENIYKNYVRLHPFLEQETSYYPTSSQLAAIARAQCPPTSSKTLVILGGNSVFNGSGQKTDELWSRVLQQELGDAYHVVNFSAPGAGVVDNGGVVYEMLSREYPRLLFVTNTEPGYYPPAERSGYSYLFWDAYFKGTLTDDADRAARLRREPQTDGLREYKLGYRLNSAFYFNDLWTGVAYRHVSTVWTSWLKERSFRARGHLPDWYDERYTRKKWKQPNYEEMAPELLEALRRRKSVAPERFQQADDGSWRQTDQTLRAEAEQITALLPKPLVSRALVVFTPVNPWLLERLTPDERGRAEASSENAVEFFGQAGWRVMPTLNKGFEPADFVDTAHLKPPGGRRLAHLVAREILSMNPSPEHTPAR